MVWLKITTRIKRRLFLLKIITNCWTWIWLSKISEVCSQLDVDGLRGDIVTNRAAKAYAAYNGKTKVTTDDLKNYNFMFTSSFKKRSLEAIDSGDKVSKVFKEIEIED
jgi:magnesium chelatase subunit I